MTQNNRIYKLRSELGLSQDDFAKRIGVTRSLISKIENDGDRTVTEQMTRSICREFNVDYFWLTEGIGEPFLDTPDTIIDDLVVQYNLDAEDRQIIENYIKADKSVRAGLKTFLKSFT